MKFIDNLIAGFAPRFALARIQSRMAIKAFYESAQTGRLHKKRTDVRDADGVNQNAIVTNRTQARHLEENHDLAKGALDVLVDNVIGQGLRPEPMVKTIDGDLSTETNAAILELWRDWIKRPEVTWELDYYSVQRLQARTWFRDGECLTQLLSGNVTALDHGTVVPFSLELIEPDLLPMDLNDSAKNIVQGVQKNVWNRPRAYFIYKQHPGSDIGLIALQDTKRVSADRIIHLKSMDRIGQTRGMTKFACVLNRLDDVKEIEESERVAARVAAAMSGFIKKGSPELYVPPNDPADREMDFVPGMIFDDLAIGEEIQSIISNRPNNALVDFRATQLRAAASGLGSSYSSIAKDYNGSYSAQRQELLESHIHYGTLWHYFSEVNARPTYEQFVTMALTTNLIPLGSDVDLNTVFDVDFPKPVMPWVDPQKEYNALKTAIELGIKSKSQTIRERGNNPDEVFKQIDEERANEPEEPGPSEEEIDEQEREEEEQDQVKQFVMSVINK
jgi:lambda family phage portal protein